jgi:hypothetical protein
MSEMLMAEVTVGDKVRVQFHPPNPMRSFCEGVVRGVDVATPDGRVFVVEVTHEVILDREHRIRPGFQDYVRYECQNDFPGRIEILPTAENEVQGETRDPAPDPTLGEPPGEPRHEGDEQPLLGREVHLEADHEPSQVEVERQEPRQRGGLIGRLFGRQK